MQDSTNLYEQCYYYGTMNTGFKLQKCSETSFKRFNGLRGKKHEDNKLITEYMECDERSGYSKNVNFIYTAAKAIDMQRYDEMSHIIMRHDSDDLDDPRSYIRDCSPFYYKGDREPKEELHSIVIPPLANSEGECLSLRDIAEQYQLMDWHKLTALVEFFYANIFRDDTLVILLDDDCFSYEAKRSCYRQAAEWMLFLHMIVPKCCGGYNEYRNLRQKIKYCVTNKADGHDGSVCFIPRRIGSFLSDQKVFDYTQSYADTPTDSLYAMIARKIQEDLAQDSQTEQDRMRYMQDFLKKLDPTGKQMEASSLHLRHLSLSNMVKAFNTRKQSMRFSDAAALIAWKDAGLKEHLKTGTFTSFNVNVCVDYLRHLEKFAEQGGREQIPADRSPEILWQYLSADSEQYLNEMLFLMTCSAVTEKTAKTMLLQAADKESFLQQYCQQPDNYLYALADRAVFSAEDMKEFCELLQSFFPQSGNVALALTKRLCAKAAEQEALSEAYGHFCACMDDWTDAASKQKIHAQFLESFLQKAEAYCQIQTEAEPSEEVSADQEQTNQAGKRLDKLMEMIHVCEEAGKQAGDSEHEQERLQQIRISLCQCIEEEVQKKDYTHLFRIEYSFDKIGFLRLWGMVGAADYSAVYSVLSAEQRKALTFLDPDDLPEEMPAEEVEKGWMSYTLFLLYCMLLSDEPDGGFTDKDTFRQLQKLIKDYQWNTPEEHEIIRDFLCLPEIMERHKAGHCSKYFVLANHVSPEYTLYKELYPHYNNNDIGEITAEEQTAYPAAKDLLAYAWICVIVPEILGQTYKQPDKDNAVDEEILCEMFKAAFPERYKYVLTENEQEKLLTRIQALAQQFLDNRSNNSTDNSTDNGTDNGTDNSTDNSTASGDFYCMLAQYPEFHDWLTDNAETIYTKCLTSVSQQCAFYNSFQQDVNMKKVMEAIVEKHIKGMVCDKLKALLEELYQQRQTINVNAYQWDEFYRLTIRAAQENINEHLRKLIDIYPFASFRTQSHENQMTILDSMKKYCDAHEEIDKLFKTFSSGINNHFNNGGSKDKKKSGTFVFSGLQMQVNAYTLEASIYYDEAKGQYDFSAIKDNKVLFSKYYKDKDSSLPPRTLKYVAYAAYMYVYTTGGDYVAYFQSSLDANKVLFEKDKTFLLAYLIWLLQDFQERIHSTTDETRFFKVQNASDECMRKIGVVFENVDKYIDNVLLTREELYRILWDYAPVDSRAWYQTSGKNNESFFKEYERYCQLQRALKNNSSDAVYKIFSYACYAYWNNVVTDEEKKQLYSLLRQSYNRMTKKDKQTYGSGFEGLAVPSDDLASVSVPVPDFDNKIKMQPSAQKPMPGQNQGVEFGSAQDIFRQPAGVNTMQPADTPNQGHGTQNVKLEDIIKPEESALPMENDPACQAFVQLIPLSTEENIQRFEVCIQKGHFDEETQKLWDEWLGLYAQVPAHLRKFMFDSDDYITQELEWRSMQDS